MMKIKSNRNGLCSVLGLRGGREEGDHKEERIGAEEWCPGTRKRQVMYLRGRTWVKGSCGPYLGGKEWNN